MRDAAIHKEITAVSKALKAENMMTTPAGSVLGGER
jgi:hypothetical protein